MNSARWNRRGGALILSITALVLLLLIGLTFARLTGIEKDASANHHLAVHARMAAAAAVEVTIASTRQDVAEGRLVELENNGWPAPTMLSLHEAGSIERYLVATPEGEVGAIDDGRPGAMQMCLSFGTELDDLAGDRPISGWIDQETRLGGRRAVYQLRVLDANQRISLSEFPTLHQEGVVRLLDNVGLLCADGFQDRVLVRGADDLSRARRLIRDGWTGQDDGWANAWVEFRFHVLDGQLGRHLQGWLIAGGEEHPGYSAWGQVVEALRSAYGPRIASLPDGEALFAHDLALLSRVVTFVAFLDPHTVSPNLDGLPEPSDGTGHEAAYLRTASQDHRRAPINVNRADRLVLAATLLGLRAEYIGPPAHERDDPGGGYAWPGDRFERQVEIDRERALLFADKIIKYRLGDFAPYAERFSYVTTNPIESWSELSHVLQDNDDALVQLVLANANPSARLLGLHAEVDGRYRPRNAGIEGVDLAPSAPSFVDHAGLFDATWVMLHDRDEDGVPDPGYGVPPQFGESLFHRVPRHERWIDKSHLTQYTAEFCFQSPGVYEIEAAGLVLDDRDRVLARHDLRTAVEVARSLHLRTQEQFLRHLYARSKVVLGPESIEIDRETFQHVASTTGELRLDDDSGDDGQSLSLSLDRTFVDRVAGHNRVDVRVGRPRGGLLPLAQRNSRRMRENASPRGGLGDPGGFGGGFGGGLGGPFGSESRFGLSIYQDGNRAADGIHTYAPPDDRYLAYRADAGFPVSGGSKGAISFWIKVSEEFLGDRAVARFGTVGRDEAARRPMGLFMQQQQLSTDDPDTDEDESRAIQRLFYVHGDANGRQFRFSSTYCIQKGTLVENIDPDNRDTVRRTFSGLMTDEIQDSIRQEGFEAIRAEYERLYSWAADAYEDLEPYYQNFAEVYLRKATEALASGRESFNVYIIEAELAEGIDDLFENGMDTNLTFEEIEARRLAHRACASVSKRTVELPGDWVERTVSRASEAFLGEVNITEQMTHSFSGQRLSEEQLFELFQTHDQIIAAAQDNPFPLSRVDSWVDVPASWRPGEWHHISLVWDDELEKGEVKIFLDQAEAPEVESDVYGNMTAWGSRSQTYGSEFSVGPFVLHRASPEGGRWSQDITGPIVRLSARSSIADFRVFDDRFALEEIGEEGGLPIYTVDPPLPPFRRFSRNGMIQLRIPTADLEEFGPNDLPRGWRFRGTVRLEGEFPTVHQLPDGWTQTRLAEEGYSPAMARPLAYGDPERTDPLAERMHRVRTFVNGLQTGSGGAVDGGLLRDAAGVYRDLRIVLLFQQNNGIDHEHSTDAAEVDEHLQGRRTPIVDAIEIRYLVPTRILAWDETLAAGLATPPVAAPPAPALFAPVPGGAPTQETLLEPTDRPDPPAINPIDPRLVPVLGG